MAPKQPGSGANPGEEPRWVTLQDGRRFELAAPAERFGARLIDSILLAAVSLAILAAALFAISIADDAADVDVVVFAVLTGLLLILFIAAAYETAMVTRRGQTVGKIALGIKVVRTEGDENPAWRSALKRWALPSLPGVIFWLVFTPLVSLVGPVLIYFSLTWDQSRQGWHDKFAETFVVRVS